MTQPKIPRQWFTDVHAEDEAALGQFHLQEADDPSPIPRHGADQSAEQKTESVPEPVRRAKAKLVLMHNQSRRPDPHPTAMGRGPDNMAAHFDLHLGKKRIAESGLTPSRCLALNLLRTSEHLMTIIAYSLISFSAVVILPTRPSHRYAQVTDFLDKLLLVTNLSTKAE